MYFNAGPWWPGNFVYVELPILTAFIGPTQIASYIYYLRSRQIWYICFVMNLKPPRSNRQNGLESNLRWGLYVEGLSFQRPKKKGQMEWCWLEENAMLLLSTSCNVDPCRRAEASPSIWAIIHSISWFSGFVSIVAHRLMAKMRALGGCILKIARGPESSNFWLLDIIANRPFFEPEVLCCGSRGYSVFQYRRRRWSLADCRLPLVAADSLAS
jgi:hypothetical protein